jgi:RNA polymerase sigma-70 factor (ECF subfamily)
MTETQPSPADEAADERQLVGQLQAGDAEAYEQLVREQGGRMLAVARRMLRNDDDARDAVQDAFISAVKAIDRFEGQSKLGTWLHRILVNAALMKIRSKKRRKDEVNIEALLPRFKEDGHAIEPATEWNESAEAAVQRSELKVLVLESIDRLPEKYRTVMLLRDIEQVSTEEAAQLLEVSTNVVKTRLHRARQSLRALLDPHLRKDGA